MTGAAPTCDGDRTPPPSRLSETLGDAEGKTVWEILGKPRDQLETYSTCKQQVLYAAAASSDGRVTKEMVDREECVRSEPDNPECYKKIKTDRTNRKKTRKSSYLRDYERIYRPEDITVAEFYAQNKGNIPRGSAPKGLKRIALETGLPLRDLKDVYDAGVGAYASSGSRPGMSAEQWGYGRVYAFIMAYFHNEDGKYDNQRFLKNKTDFHIFQIFRHRHSVRSSQVIPGLQRSTKASCLVVRLPPVASVISSHLISSVFEF